MSDTVERLGAALADRYGIDVLVAIDDA